MACNISSLEQATAVSYDTSFTTVPAGGRTLTGEVRSRASLSAREREAMFSLFEQFYLSADRAQFGTDLEDKDWVATLFDEHHSLCGFSTMKEYTAPFPDGLRTALIFFSGDTIVHPRCWGSPELPRIWTRHMFTRTLERKLPLSFWFLISSGYKTYRLLPLFFQSFVPQRDREHPQQFELMTQLADERFGNRYDRHSGTIRLDHPTPLRPGVADITERELRNEHTRFFTARNPRWSLGEELAGLAQLHPSNLTKAGLKMVGSELLSRLADASMDGETLSPLSSTQTARAG
ncbi:MAG: hypothetical protein U0136_17240 [Bdellovibrionota bacterium]